MAQRNRPFYYRALHYVLSPCSVLAQIRCQAISSKGVHLRAIKVSHDLSVNTSVPGRPFGLSGNMLKNNELLRHVKGNILGKTYGRV